MPLKCQSHQLSASFMKKIAHQNQRENYHQIGLVSYKNIAETETFLDAN